MTLRDTIPLEGCPPDADVYVRHFGAHELQDVPVDSIVMLPQMRGTVNSQLEKLMASIDEIGLLNPPNLANPTEDELGRYIDFTNKTWDNAVSIDDFSERRRKDGHYTLAAAGHSRILSIEMLQSKYKTETGRLARYMVRSMILPDASVGSIVQIQAAENIHTAVPPEREAIAVVELYQFGLEKGFWSSPEEFKKLNNNISGPVIRDAMTFAVLPKPVRNAVLFHHIGYAPGIQLGKTTGLLFDYHKAKLGLRKDEEPSDRLRPLIQKNVDEHLLYMMAHIESLRKPKAKLPPNAASIEYIKAEAGGLLNELSKLWSEPEVDALISMQDVLRQAMGMADPEQDALVTRLQTARRRHRLLRDIGAAPVVDVAERLSLFTEADKSDGMIQVVEQTRQANDYLAHRVQSMMNDGSEEPTPGV